METVKTQGIVLKSIPYSDNSSIVRIYTRELGLISCLVRGITRKNSKVNKYSLQNLAIVEMVTGRNKFSDLYHISEVNPIYNYTTINSYPAIMTKNCIFMFVNEFLSKCIKEGEHSTKMFDYMMQSLITLDSDAQTSSDYHIIFLTHIAGYLGINFPEPTTDTYCFYDIQNNVWCQTLPSHSNYIPAEYVSYILNAKKLNVNEKIDFCRNGSQRRAITEYLIRFYQYHIPEIGKIQSLEILSMILN